MSEEEDSLGKEAAAVLAELAAAADGSNQTAILEGLSFRGQKSDEALSAYTTNCLDAVQKILSNRQREAQTLGTWEYEITETWKYTTEKHSPRSQPPSPAGSPRKPSPGSPSSPARAQKSSEELIADFKARLLRDLSFALKAGLFAGHDEALRKLEQAGVILPPDYKPLPNASSEKFSPRRRAMDPRPRSASLSPRSKPTEPPATPPPPPKPALPTAEEQEKAAEDARRKAEENRRKAEDEEQRRKAAEAAETERKRRAAETEKAERRRKEEADAAQRARQEQEAERQRAEETARKAKDAAAAEAARKQRELDKYKSTPPAPKPASLPIPPAEDGEGLKYFVQACTDQGYSIKERKPDHASAIIDDSSDKGEIHYKEQDSVPPRLYTEGSLSNPFQNMALILVRMMLLQNKNVATVYLSEDVYNDHFIPAFAQAKRDLVAAGLKTADLEAENRPEGPSSAPRMST